MAPYKLRIVKSFDNPISVSMNTYSDFIHKLIHSTHQTPEKTKNDILMCDDDSTRGYRFEALSLVLVILKCVFGFNYTQLHEGNAENHKVVANTLSFLSKKIRQGNNDIDMCFVDDDTTIAVSCKNYTGEKMIKDSLGIINISSAFELLNKKRLSMRGNEEKYKIGLFVRDKTIVLSHKYKDGNAIEKTLLDEINKNGLLYDESDLVSAIAYFNHEYSTCKTVGDVLDKLNVGRKQLVKMLHQRMVELKFQLSFNEDPNQLWCLSHKPRAGKSITLLLFAKHMLSRGFKRVLLLTSVPVTFESFKDALDKWNEFQHINYITQENIHEIDEKFSGLIMCSVQFLKTGEEKLELIKDLKLDGIISDEAHLATSTDKTKNTILSSYTDDAEIDSDINHICKSVKCCVFASGTSQRTIRYYNINSTRNYVWDIEDEAFMKLITQQNEENIKDVMVKRHGEVFVDCLNDCSLNSDYTKYPTLVLLRHKFPEHIKTLITEYNAKHGTDYGLSYKSILALKPSVTKSKTKSQYLDRLKLEETADGKEMMKAIIQQIVSPNRMQKTVLKKCEKIQTRYSSRINSKEEPKLILVYLPVNTGNSSILELQQAIKRFVDENGLWKDYLVHYASSAGDSNASYESYDKSIESMIKEAKDNGKRGCILLLGKKGTVGVTYHDCDITISLDDGHNLEQKKQSDYRAMTDAPGKTIGINVDMNVQRYYANILKMITGIRQRLGKQMSNEEVLYYAYKNNIFIVEADELGDCELHDSVVRQHFKQFANELACNIDDDIVLDSFVCDDKLKSFIIADIKARQKNIEYEKEDGLEGLQQDLNKGDVKPEKLKNVNGDVSKEIQNEKDEECEDEHLTNLTNITLEVFKQYLLPLLGLISRATHITDFTAIVNDSEAIKIVWAILEEKKIEIKPSDYNTVISIMTTILKANDEIVSQIRSIYETASPSHLRCLIDRHFKPTEQEKKDNAEVPTPVKLVDDMLNKIDIVFWTKPQKVLEPCCGKGNFVLAIFDKFYEGLEQVYPDEMERCKVIATECIYFADISHLNVFITTELLKCHIQSYCGLDTLDYKFNSYVGNTLEIDIMNVWDIDRVEGVVMNPPYNSKGNIATGNTIWQLFTKKALNEWLKPNGYLCAVHPPGWRKPNTEKGKFTGMFELMTRHNKMIHLDIHNTKDGMKMFKCGTRYDWYVIQKTNPENSTTNIVDEYGETTKLQLHNFKWLPNSNIELISSILAKDGDERCPIMYDRSKYGADKKWVSKIQDSIFKYPCIHSTPKEGTRYMYSSVNDRGHFGISKVIFGESGINSPVIDIAGVFGMTHGAMAIEVTNENEANNIISSITSDKFTSVIKSCLFSSFRIDWNIFTSFKKDFWKEFI